jgi:hypothetical protein
MRLALLVPADDSQLSGGTRRSRVSGLAPGTTSTSERPVFAAYLARYEEEDPRSGKLSKDIALEEAQWLAHRLAGLWDRVNTEMEDWSTVVDDARLARVSVEELEAAVEAAEEFGSLGEPDYFSADPLRDAMREAIQR